MKIIRVQSTLILIIIIMFSISSFLLLFAYFHCRSFIENTFILFSFSKWWSNFCVYSLFSSLYYSSIVIESFHSRSVFRFQCSSQVSEMALILINTRFLIGRNKTCFNFRLKYLKGDVSFCFRSHKIKWVSSGSGIFKTLGIAYECLRVTIENKWKCAMTTIIFSRIFLLYNPNNHLLN